MSSPESGKYVVYTVDTDQESSSGLDEGQIVFRDPQSSPNGDRVELKRRSIRYTSSELSFGSYWSKREKCCCLFNLLLLIGVVCLATVFILYQKNVFENTNDERNSSETNSHVQTGKLTTERTPIAATQSIPKVITLVSINCSVFL